MLRVRPGLLLFSCLLAVGCGHRPKEGEAITDVCVLANDGKTVSASGYLAYTRTTYCDSYGCPFYLQQKLRDEPGSVSIRVSFPEGTGARQVEVLKRVDFNQEDIVFRDDNGVKFGLGDVIRVTGKADINAVGDKITCTMYHPAGVQKL